MPLTSSSLRSIGFASVLFGLAIAMRNWAMLVALSLTFCGFWRYKRMKLAQQRIKRRPKMSEEEMEAKIAEWKPEPLVPNYSDEELKDPAFQPRTIEGKMKKIVNIDGRECLNMASSDFYGFIGDSRIEEVAKKTIFKYGVGSCGPRNFYGTVDVHLDLERELAEFLGCEEAILYSYGFPTIASAIPAYSKRGDIIYADKGVNFAIQSGLQASRSDIIWFEHNDTKDLERKMEEQKRKDDRNPRKAASIRRFIIVEGLYANSGDICPLPKLIELKWRYKTRIFMDESFSFGVLGQHGKGVTEHFGVDVIDVDLISASLENAMATTGGFCCGRSFVIGHQRLSGLGYCFSASLPPLLATAASEALRIIIEWPDRIRQLRSNAIRLDQLIQKAVDGTPFRLLSADISPLKHIGHDEAEEEGEGIGEKEAERRLDVLIKELLHEHILVTRARYLQDKEAFPPKPTLKILCRADMTEEEVEEVGAKFANAIQKAQE